MRVTNLIIALLVLTHSLNVKSDTDMIPYYFFNAASAFKIDVALLYAFCTEESRCNINALNKDDGTAFAKSQGVKSPSHGMFQIKLPTARSLGFAGSSKQLMKPEINTWYASKLLRSLYNKYKDTSKVISAYNAGHPITGNKKYVFRVLRAYAHYKIDKRY